MDENPTPLERRRAFRLDGYETLADVGLDVPWVSPLQIKAHSPTGPVLVAYNWSDAATARKCRDFLWENGFLPKIPFNMVLDRALSDAGLSRSDVYMTQAFHLLTKSRSAPVPYKHVRASFEAITYHEVKGRPVIALGGAASHACDVFGIRHIRVPHPSSRGSTFLERAQPITDALRRLTS